ncbi:MULTISPECIES: SDR family NAD(P)-dependent oxidoreductase [unclassified Caballeronia]|uniref:SDR family NAD(P)-dependent oxidoreductase n=1 Tax=unclassified Caballeronia TaxID=2646786 RepID=UPI001588A176|nr:MULTISPECIES: SDR family oxidoreductase [unclassified Caballeronia]
MTVQDAFSLGGKRILVTGASSGIGRQIAVRCAQAGATVIATGRDEARLRSLIDELGGEGHGYFTCDLGNDDSIKQLAQDVGKFDGIVHSAGIAALAPLRLASRTHIEDQFRINALGPILLTQQLLVRNAVNRGGSIVFISSISAHIGVAGVGAYGGSKGALESMARVLSMEVAKRAIRVNCLAPGSVETPMLQAARRTTDSIDETAARYPLGLGLPDDVAYTAIFFLSSASRWITGTTLVMDGGHTVG